MTRIHLGHNGPLRGSLHEGVSRRSVGWGEKIISFLKHGLCLHSDGRVDEVFREKSFLVLLLVARLDPPEVGAVNWKQTFNNGGFTRLWVTFDFCRRSSQYIMGGKGSRKLGKSSLRNKRMKGKRWYLNLDGDIKKDCKPDLIQNDFNLDDAEIAHRFYPRRL